MEPHRLMDELLSVARKLGLQVRIEPFVTPGVLAGGLCWVRGRQLILIDENAPPVERAGAMAEALSTFDVEGVYMPPQVRGAIEAARLRSQLRPGPRARGDTPPGSTDGSTRSAAGSRSADPGDEQEDEQ